MALVALAVLGWVGALTRNHELGHDAAVRVFREPRLSRAETERDLRQLDRADLLDPDSHWDMARAARLMLAGRPRAAGALARQVAREEPDNVAAWRVVLQAAGPSDPERAARARAALRRLDPLASR